MNVLTQKSYMVGLHRYAYRVGQPAEIMGMKWVKPDGDYEWRIAFEIEFFDGKRDFIPYFEVVAGLYVIISDVDLANERIPDVNQ